MGLIQKNRNYELVYFCQVRNTIFFLDAKCNEYSCIEVADGDAVARLLREISQENKENGSKNWADKTAELGTFGVVLDLNFLERLSLCPPPPPAVQDLFGVRNSDPAQLTLGQIFRFFIAYFKTLLMTKCFSFSTIIRRIQYRRKAPSTYSMECLKKEVEAYHRLKPLYTSTDNCYFDSLVMLEFLSLSRIYPMLAFGINVNPFLAHCWVQMDGMVLNDRQDLSAATYPIFNI